MHNFSPEDVMQRLHALEQAAARHIPVGEGTETDLEKRVAALEEYKAQNELGATVEIIADKVEKLWQHVFDVAGVGPAEQAGVVVDASELKAGDVGEFVKPATDGTAQG